MPVVTPAGGAGSSGSPWVAIHPGTDVRRRAQAMGRAHAATMGGDDPPAHVRDVVVRSWNRAKVSGVDPEGRAPRIVDDAAARRALSRHRLAPGMPAMRARLGLLGRDGGYLAALSDERGLLLWADGDSRMLDAAAGVSFVPGHSCHEDDVGTNAIGTALAVGHALQIFSAEHFNRRLHGWTCAAAPIVDPTDGSVIGALNLSTAAARGNPDAVGFVEALARTFELELGRAIARSDEQLRARFLSDGLEREAVLVNADGRVLHCDPGSWIGTTMTPPAPGTGPTRLPDGSLGAWTGFGTGYVVRRVERADAVRDQAIVTQTAAGRVTFILGARRLELTPRHGAIVVALARHPAGLEPGELASEVYGSPVRAVTVRAEVSRLRRVLGAVVNTNPYRLDVDVRLVDDGPRGRSRPQQRATARVG